MAVLSMPSAINNPTLRFSTAFFLKLPKSNVRHTSFLKKTKTFVMVKHPKLVDNNFKKTLIIVFLLFQIRYVETSD